MKGHLLFIFLFISISILAQKSTYTTGYSISPSFSVDNESFNVGDLNDFLISRGYFPSPYSLTNVAIGISMKDNTTPWIFKAYYFQGEANNFEPDEKSSISSVGIRMELLYDLIKNDKWTIAPVLGLQTTDYQLISVSKNGISPLTGNRLEEIVQLKDLYQFRPGFSLDRKVNLGFFDWYFGLEVLYNIQFGKGSWQNSGRDDLNLLPSTNFSGLCIGLNGRLMINLDRLSKKYPRRMN